MSRTITKKWYTKTAESDKGKQQQQQNTIKSQCTLNANEKKDKTKDL